jgi:hypothetical protein
MFFFHSAAIISQKPFFYCLHMFRAIKQIHLQVTITSTIFTLTFCFVVLHSVCVVLDFALQGHLRLSPDGLLRPAFGLVVFCQGWRSGWGCHGPAELKWAKPPFRILA